jgi:hypothetical protein
MHFTLFPALFDPRLAAHRCIDRHAPHAAALPSSYHSFKKRTGDRTGEAIGSDFYRLDRWFTGSLSGFLSYKIMCVINKYCNKGIHIYAEIW